MRPTRTLRFLDVYGSFLLVVVALVCASAAPACAQGVMPHSSESGASVGDMAAGDAMLTLPDAPGSVRSGVGSDVSSSEAGAASLDGASVAAFGSDPVRQHVAPATDKYILPGERVVRLTARDKVALGLKDAVSPFSMIGWVTAALYAQAIDGAPNYGTNGKAFAQRLGASAARASTEGVLSDSIMAPVFHEDPRYYKMGPGHPMAKRALYAATRVVVTRSDDGRRTPNFALLAGNLAGCVLTNVYYPEANRSFAQTTETFAGSIGGSALGFVVSEFLSDTLELVHLKKRE